MLSAGSEACPRWALVVDVRKAARFSRRLGPHLSVRRELHRWWGRSQGRRCVQREWRRRRSRTMRRGCVTEHSLEAFRQIGPSQREKDHSGRPRGLRCRESNNQRRARRQHARHTDAAPGARHRRGGILVTLVSDLTDKAHGSPCSRPATVGGLLAGGGAVRRADVDNGPELALKARAPISL